MDKVLIRKGREDDLPDLLKLIRELAEYERCPGEVEAGIAELRSWGFGDNPVYGFFAAEKEGRVIGIALYYFKYSTWKGRCLYLEDLIVTGAERRRGYGTLLFDAVVELAKSEKVRRLEWQALDWNQPALDFYAKYNATVDGGWLNCRLTLEQLQRL